MEQGGTELRAFDIEINPVRTGKPRRLVFHFRSDIDHDARVGVRVPGTYPGHPRTTLIRIRTIVGRSLFRVRRWRSLLSRDRFWSETILAIFREGGRGNGNRWLRRSCSGVLSVVFIRLVKLVDGGANFRCVSRARVKRQK